MSLGSQARDQGGEGIGPWELLPDLWIGGSHAATQAPLERLGISAILNVSDVDLQSQARGLQYLHLRVLDHTNSDIVSIFWRAKPFLDSVAARRGSVLVHCAFGMNRSASICVAWLMVRNRLTLAQAFQLVYRNRRKPIVMNFSFRKQLVALAQELGQL
jgi:dual specificity MAP kinase phosphatase